MVEYCPGMTHKKDKMNLTTWDVRYSIGIDELDDHHRYLVLLINIIYESFVNEVQDCDLAKIFNELTRYTEYHFCTEETLMRDCNYPDYDSHKALHDQFAKRLQDIQAGFLCNKSLVSFELLTFLNSWLLTHVTKTDIQFGKFIAAEQKKFAA